MPWAETESAGQSPLAFSASCCQRSRAGGWHIAVMSSHPELLHQYLLKVHPTSMKYLHQFGIHRSTLLRRQCSPRKDPRTESKIDLDVKVYRVSFQVAAVRSQRCPCSPFVPQLILNLCAYHVGMVNLESRVEVQQLFSLADTKWLLPHRPAPAEHGPPVATCALMQRNTVWRTHGQVWRR